jgi:hypothetical protein
VKTSNRLYNKNFLVKTSNQLYNQCGCIHTIKIIYFMEKLNLLEQGIKDLQWNLSNPTYQGTGEMCQIVQDVRILMFDFR